MWQEVAPTWQLGSLGHFYALSQTAQREKINKQNPQKTKPQPNHPTPQLRALTKMLPQGVSTGKTPGPPPRMFSGQRLSCFIGPCPAAQQPSPLPPHYMGQGWEPQLKFSSSQAKERQALLRLLLVSFKVTSCTAPKLAISPGKQLLG